MACSYAATIIPLWAQHTLLVTPNFAINRSSNAKERASSLQSLRCKSLTWKGGRSAITINLLNPKYRRKLKRFGIFHLYMFILGDYYIIFACLNSFFRYNSPCQGPKGPGGWQKTAAVALMGARLWQATFYLSSPYCIEIIFYLVSWHLTSTMLDTSVSLSAPLLFSEQLC